MRSWIALAVLAVAAWFAPPAANAQPARPARTVQDDLGMFSAEAKSKANAEIARIKQQFKKDLVIETAHAPKRPATVDKDDKAAVSKFFDQWASERFKNEQINGVYVLIVDNPHILRVLVGPETSRLGLFTDRNRDELFQKVQEKLKAGDKDGALHAATGYVLDAMQRHGRPAASAAPAGQAETPTGERSREVQASPIVKWVLIGLGVLLVIWLVSAVVRGFSAMGGGGAGYGAGAGAGGFMQGFLGGMLGAAAGMWAYNHFLGSSTPSAYGSSTTSAGSEPTDVGAGDPSVTGGDYGDAAGHDDAGGGDWGGDAGGDWGGGGDFGGGGGDW